MMDDRVGNVVEALGQEPVGKIAARLPGATAVFRAFGIDFCCHGAATLADAAREKGLAPAAIEEELRRLAQHGAAAGPEHPREPTALIDYILRTYHEKHRKDLPELIALARRVEQVHRKHPLVPLGLATFLQRMQASLESHMFKEEMILFPALRRGVQGGLGFPLAQMRREHDDHGETFRELAARTANGVAPHDACPTWWALYAGTNALADELMAHIHLENNLLFPQFE